MCRLLSAARMGAASQNPGVTRGHWSESGAPRPAPMRCCPVDAVSMRSCLMVVDEPDQGEFIGARALALAVCGRCIPYARSVIPTGSACSHG